MHKGTPKFILTVSKAKLDPFDPDPDQINMSDIAHSLSNICRFGGHCSEFYSVAQHCVLVSEYLFERTKDIVVSCAGLIHDASEAYMIDMPNPIKVRLPDYVKTEENLLSVIYKKFQIPPCKAFVKNADMVLLATEARDLMGDPQDWNLNVIPWSRKVIPLSPKFAKDAFIDRWQFFKDHNILEYQGIENVR